MELFLPKKTGSLKLVTTSLFILSSYRPQSKREGDKVKEDNLMYSVSGPRTKTVETEETPQEDLYEAMD